MIDLTRVPVVM